MSRDDIFDTRFENQEVELPENLVVAGQEVNLAETESNLKEIVASVGWDLNAFDTEILDMDFSLFLLDKNDMTRIDEDFIFYNNTQTGDRAVEHQGDSRTGAGDGDDESIRINLEKLPYDIPSLVFVITIYKGREKEQNMGMVRNAYLRLVNAENKHEILRYNLDKILQEKEETGLIAGVLKREGPKWHFTAMEEFVLDGLSEIAKRYGILISNQ